MKSFASLRLFAAVSVMACTGVTVSPAIAQMSPGFGQGSPSQLPAPPRVGNTANDEQGLEAEFDSLRAQRSRAEFLSDEKRQLENRQAAQRFASCAIGFNEERVRQLLDQAVEGKASKKVEIGEFLNRNQGCVVAVGGIDRDFLRGALAEELLVGSAGAVAIPAPGDAATVREFIKSVKAPNAKTDDPFTMGQFAAECRTGFAPVQVRGLLESEAGSAAERGALAVLKAVTPQCDSFKVEGRELTPHFERAYAAQALYHWVDLAPQLDKR